MVRYEYDTDPERAAQRAADRTRRLFKTYEESFSTFEGGDHPWSSGDVQQDFETHFRHISHLSQPNHQGIQNRPRSLREGDNGTGAEEHEGNLSDYDSDLTDEEYEIHDQRDNFEDLIDSPYPHIPSAQPQQAPEPMVDDELLEESNPQVEADNASGIEGQVQENEHGQDLADNVGDNPRVDGTESPEQERLRAIGMQEDTGADPGQAAMEQEGDFGAADENNNDDTTRINEDRAEQIQEGFEAVVLNRPTANDRAASSPSASGRQLAGSVESSGIPPAMENGNHSLLLSVQPVWMSSGSQAASQGNRNSYHPATFHRGSKRSFSEMDQGTNKAGRAIAVPRSSQRPLMHGQASTESAVGNEHHQQLSQPLPLSLPAPPHPPLSYHASQLPPGNSPPPATHNANNFAQQYTQHQLFPPSNKHSPARQAYFRAWLERNNVTVEQLTQRVMEKAKDDLRRWDKQNGGPPWGRNGAHGS